MADNPVLGIGSSLGFKAESQVGSKISLTGGSFLDLVDEDLDYKPIKYEDTSPIGGRVEFDGDKSIISHNDGGGSFSHRPHAIDIDEYMALLLGGTDTGYKVPIIAQSSDLTTFTLESNKAGMNTIRLIGNKINTAAFKSEANQPLVITSNIISMSGERDASDLASPVYTNMGLPFMHGMLGFDATGVAWLGGASGPAARSIEFTINNNLTGDDTSFCNSTTRKIIPVGLFSCEGTMEIPYNATSKGFWAAIVVLTVVPFKLTFNDNDGTTAEFLFNAQFDGDLPKIADKKNIWLPLKWHTVKTSSNAWGLKFKKTTV
jgi:hypothetical protein